MPSCRDCLYPGDECRFQRCHMLFTSLLQNDAHAFCIGNECGYVYPQTHVIHSFQIVDPTCEKADRTAMVAVTPVMQCDRDLEGSL